MHRPLSPEEFVAALAHHVVSRDSTSGGGGPSASCEDTSEHTDADASGVADTLLTLSELDLAAAVVERTRRKSRCSCCYPLCSPRVLVGLVVNPSIRSCLTDRLYFVPPRIFLYACVSSSSFCHLSTQVHSHASHLCFY